MKLFLLIFVLSTSAQAGWVKSIGFGFNYISSDSELRTEKGKSLMTFWPNVSSGTGLSLETEHLSLGYVFSGSQGSNPRHEKSNFSDFRFNFHAGHFDFRLSVQNYQGAIVKEGGVEHFYSDYKMKSTNARFHFYSNRRHLDFIRVGQKLAKQIGSNRIGSSGSWLFGLNVDGRRIQLPAQLVSAHQAILTANGVTYNREFTGVSSGPLIGYDFLLQGGPLFLRAKAAVGPTFFANGGNGSQSEVSLMSGFALGPRHLFTISADLFAVGFEGKQQELMSNNVQTVLGYTYAFN